MDKQEKNKSLGSIFQKELETLKRSQMILDNQELSDDELKEEYRLLSKKYQKLLREMKKITRIGDVNYKKLLDANEQIGKQKSELELLNNQLTEAKATQDKFYSIIAHDLRNPLQFLLFSTEVLEVDYENMDEESKRSYIRKVYKTVQNTSDLLENLLQWSLSQYGKLECRPRPVRLFNPVHDIINFYQETAEKKKIDISHNIPENVNVFADEDMVRTILRNLVSNALKFTQADGKVELSCRESGKFIIISVNDTGLGIKRDQLLTLFKMGLNTSSSGTASEKGNGLGLILCKELVEKNGGELNVSSTPGKGSQFDFSLPVYE
jgi:signal transduction histidine kinase